MPIGDLNFYEVCLRNMYGPFNTPLAFMQHATYFEAVDIASLMQEFPVGYAFTEKFTSMQPVALREHQKRLFKRQLQRAWQSPFCQRFGGAARIKPANIQSVDDIAKLPSFDKQDIPASIERQLHLGDHHAREISVN